MKIGYLGPIGSYSSLVCEEIYPFEEKISYNTISLSLKDLKEDKLDFAVVPIENSINGGVGETLDGLYNNHLIITKIVTHPIKHCLATLNKSSKIELIYSHHQALAQCNKYITKNYPHAEIISMNSTSEALRKISEEKLVNAAAIGSESATKKYNLKILDKYIQDYKNNQTKFAIVGKEYLVNKKSSMTSIVVNPKKNLPGTLADILMVLKKKNINLVKIESRPSKNHSGDYIFYMDLDGKYEDKNISCALLKLGKKSKINFLGCYPEVKKK
jgi:prephenate dehydratase